jgi:hypothetical protein
MPIANCECPVAKCALQGTSARGTQNSKKQTTGPYDTWLVGSSEAKKVPGLVRSSPRFFVVFFLVSSLRNAQKRDHVLKQIEKKSVSDFLLGYLTFFV